MATIWKVVGIAVVILLIGGLLLGGAGLLTGASAERVATVLTGDLHGLENASLNLGETVSGLVTTLPDGAG